MNRGLRVLITGFGPFPGARFNPTAALARRLALLRRPAFAAVTRIAHVFAVTYGDVDRMLPELIARHRPDVVLMFGLAPRARVLRVETRARNTVTTLWPDAGHRRGRSGQIVRGGPAALSFGPHALRLFHALRATRLPATPSRNAGRYLCNYLCWRAIEASHNGTPRLAAFIHVPPLAPGSRPRRRNSRRRWSGDDLARAGEALLRALVIAGRRARRA
ncbi:MAG: pyroglutamyl-peptidase I [Xanthobacteraceae bacterium]|nr:MAG: pyroglutamyl-peptidase I [Xanthobacteraceae bacterium]